MNIYQVSCFSDCDSYFDSYLQFVIVVAESPEDAEAKCAHRFNTLGIAGKSLAVERLTPDDYGIVYEHHGCDY